MKGNSIQRVYDIVDRLREFSPRCINITSHHSEYIYKEQGDGTHRKMAVCRRPGTVAVAAAIQYKYGIAAVPHIICKGFTPEETEYALLDLNFLGINHVFLLRGDSKGEMPMRDGSASHVHATDLQAQVNLFNQGIGIDGTRIEGIETPFTYGMACYPEKHEEAPNMATDLRYAKMKVDGGAAYLTTQMFFDNAKYFDFVARAREAGITVPIIPGVKPLMTKSQLTVLPKVFRVDLPEELSRAVEGCKSNDDVREVGVEWGVRQCRELLAHGVPGIHFYSLNASDSVRRIAKEIY